MTEQEVKDLLIKTNAIMEGHFLLTSGLHSPHYVEKFNVLQHPEYTQKLCEAMADKFKDAHIDTVVGPVTGGILLAHETGKALGTRAIFTERENGRMTFRRGFSLKPGERVLIVEHTSCAMTKSTESELQKQVGEVAGKDASWMTLGVIDDQINTIRADVQRVRSHPLISEDVLVGGFLYDVETGLLQPVV